jgi:succinyl-CoA synthetase alpha subunit
VTLFFEAPPRIVVQGATGREARMVVGHMRAYGTEVAAGVTPGRGGDEVDGVPVFDTVVAAAAATGGAFDAALVSVPPLAALDAVAEAVAAGVGLVLVATENVPLHDAMRLLALARETGAAVVGPNSVGLISPADGLKLGAIGGERPARAFVPGRVGVMSRSGGLTAEVGLQLRLRGLGVSTAVGIGGEAMIGTPPAELLRRFRADPDTDVVVYVGEPGLLLEEELAAELAGAPAATPLVAVVLGGFMEEFPPGTVFGHAAAVIEQGRGRPRDKARVLADAGARVADSFDNLFPLVEDALGMEARR